MKVLSPEELAYFHYSLEYHRDIGRFSWKKRSRNGMRNPGDLAGSEHTGMGGRPNPTGLMYRYIALGGVGARQFGEHLYGDYAYSRREAVGA